MFLISFFGLCKALSTLSQKSATVAENGETTAKFSDCRTFLRQCGQALMHYNIAMYRPMAIYMLC